MRGRSIILCAVALCGSVLPAAAQTRLQTDSALASMVAAERAFSDHSLRVNTQSALVTFMAKDGLLYRPRVVRAEAFLRARPMPPTLLVARQAVFADVAAAGDLGYTTGPWIASHRNRPDAPPTFGEYVTLWRRQDNGQWKVELDAGIAHGPDAVGPAPIRSAPASQWKRGSASTARSAELLAADSAFAAGAAREGVVTAFQKRFASDIRLLRNGRFPLTADSATAFLRATSGYTWKPVDARISTSGDLGYTYGIYAILSDTRGTRASESGDYLRIWRRDAAGYWRVVLDLTSPAG